MKKRILKLLLIYIATTIILLLSLKILDIIEYKCPYKELFHIFCAGCGTTRMIKALLKLQIYEAFRYNPLMFILGIIFGIYIIYISILYIKGKKIQIPNTKILISLGILLVIYMILRNIPYFSFLAPTIVK